MSDKRWPQPGERLVHRFRKQSGQVIATVVGVDRKSGRVAVRVGGKEFPTLSAAAAEIAGHATNGWVYWGLKKQQPKRKRLT